MSISRSNFFNREGNPISLQEWGAEFSRKDRLVIETEIPKKGKVVTVFLGDNFEDELTGVDTSTPGYRPRVYGTMIFPGMSEFRHETEEIARRRHSMIVGAIVSGDQSVIDGLKKECGV